MLLRSNARARTTFRTSTDLQYQATLRDAIEFSGVGLHSGRDARVRVLPAAANAGLRFRLDDAVEFPATAEYIVDTQRATVLGSGDYRVSTVEHLLSALSGMGISNATIAVDGPEIPVMDGSAEPFVAAIVAAGLERQAGARRCFAPAAPLVFRDADGDKVLAIVPAPSFRVRMTIEFPAPVGAQYVALEVTPETYRTEIAACRTFGFLHEVQTLIERGLAIGGSLDNAVVFDMAGPMVPLRAPNEPVRHKVLDLIGDFALLGAYPQCEIIAIKSGHQLHGSAVRAIGASLAMAV